MTIENNSILYYGTLLRGNVNLLILQAINNDRLFLYMNDWEIYTDGSYKSSIKRGGIGIVWVKDGKEVYEFAKGFDNVTNNQMELLAIGYGLKSIKKSINSLTIISDSQYALGCIFKDWKPKKNIELIKKLKNILKETQKLVNTPITYIHVKGHQIGDTDIIKYNNKCDKLCTQI